MVLSHLPADVCDLESFFYLHFLFWLFVFCFLYHLPFVAAAAFAFFSPRLVAPPLALPPRSSSFVSAPTVLPPIREILFLVFIRRRITRRRAAIRIGATVRSPCHRYYTNLALWHGAAFGLAAVCAAMFLEPKLLRLRVVFLSLHRC